MATHKSAAKRHIQSLKRRDRNRTTKSAIKTNIKALMAAIEGGEGDKKALFSKVKSAIASAGSKGILHKKTAARKIGRLEARLN